ncbi:MAG: DUF4139 domain-containing protein [Zoogloeaceae bacterium]|jgi:uncharacterized protein (TIGR02231 family)|nr:DUF4139 domain-containing protein [Zoogloeaceae bacterium]
MSTMSRFLPAVITALLACTPFAALFAADPLSASAASAAPVTSVMLYPGSALIERAAAVKAGAEGLEIVGLPANFDTSSVEVEADAGIEIGETVWRDSDRTAPLNAEEARLEAEVRKLSGRIQALDVERAAAARELKYLDTLAAPQEGHAGPQAANPAKMLEIIRQGSIGAARRILEIDTQKHDLGRELQARQNDLDRIRPAVKQVRSLSVRLRANHDGQVRLRYLFSDAGWRPAYRAALDSERGQVTLERVAQIAQKSGEDWNRVRFTLSTGQPRQSASGPSPESWDVRLINQEMAERRLSAAKAASLDIPYQAAGISEMKAPSPASFQIEITQGEYATEYLIPGAVTLPADGRKVAVSLGKLVVPVTLAAQVSPRQEKSAYLVATGDLPEGVWPAGEMRLYRNGAYVGLTNWRADSNARLELPFGRDALIRVSDRSLEDKSGSSGFAGQKSERRIAHVFTVTNQHKRPVDVRVLDASPVGHDEAVEIERHFTPAVVEENWHDRPGVIAWQHRLEAGGSQEFTADYRIRWPKDRRVTGVP